VRKIDPAAARGLVDLPCACATARRAARSLTQLYDRYLSEAEVEPAQFALLSMLDAKGPCSHAMIGRHFALDKTTLSRNLKLLRRKRWIELTATDDARERRVALTAEGRRRFAAARPAWRRAQAQLQSAMSERDWQAMWRVFRTITDAAHAAHGAAQEARSRR
jgi:DNA-binding MarR family transcriptional regulator